MRQRAGHAWHGRPHRDRRGRARQGADALRRRGARRAARPGRRRRRSTSPSIRWRAPTSAPPARPTPSPCSPPPSAAACSTPPTSTWTRSSSARPPAARVHLDAPVAENLRNIAAAFDREVSDLTIVVLDRDAPPAAHRRHPRGRRAHPPDRRRRPLGRHRGRGARHRRARGDGDRRRARGRDHRRGHALPRRRDPGAAQGHSTTSRRSGSRSWASHDPDQDLQDRGPGPGRTRSSSAATGVTDGELLRGVRFFGGGSRTSTLFMSLSRKIIRFVDTIHREQVTTPVRFI